MLFIIRLLSAICLFSFLGKANDWLNPLSNTILALGYRAFLVFSPVLVKWCGRYSVTISLLISLIGTFLFILNNNSFMVIGALCVGFGLSTSGFLIKSESSATASGAGMNKVASNIGSLMAGIILLTFLERNMFFSVGCMLLVICCVLSLLNIQKYNTILKFPIVSILSKSKIVVWALLGIIIGIKLFSVLSVMPQYLLNYNDKLPKWYGMMLFFNSGFIIVFQLPIIHLIEKIKNKNVSFTLTLIIMFIGMLLIAFPQMFYIQYFWGALIWTLLLSFIECCASYLDLYGVRSGALLVKEAFVGLGGALTVLVMRYMSVQYSSIVIGLLGIILLVIILVMRNKV